eukprot:TRINITY_DN10581_c0_g1_i1.p1 TRINITY_DN10581_c0_g1~~TRINITY_DN10581_c0_g1_i1.p1  ORF type:complete len:82 (+),score=0.95 TRINITY_DN10581_c0_g1_i1:271-516(+)
MVHSVHHLHTQKNPTTIAHLTNSTTCSYNYSKKPNTGQLRFVGIPAPNHFHEASDKKLISVGCEVICDPSSQTVVALERGN